MLKIGLKAHFIRIYPHLGCVICQREELNQGIARYVIDPNPFKRTICIKSGNLGYFPLAALSYGELSPIHVIITPQRPVLRTVTGWCACLEEARKRVAFHLKNQISDFDFRCMGARAATYSGALFFEKSTLLLMQPATMSANCIS